MKSLTLKEKIMGIVALPITLPLFSVIYLLMYITKGKKLTNESTSDFIFKFIDTFSTDIFTFLNINDTPDIQLSDEVSFKLGEFRGVTFGNSSSFIKSLFSSESAKTFNSSIVINYNSIGKRYLYNSFITKLIMVRTLIHELTHYAQYVQGRWEPNHSSSYQTYREEPCEIEARQKASSFVLKNLVRIAKFIVIN